ncbi:MAG: ferrous iron transport protein B, partial [Elusimicrobia bacterium]|nr:ferrous iron transport protein B [Elusimicrobiota bacterium]
VIDVIDSTNVERNLYLCLQFQELNVPMIVALNLSDEAASRGIVIDEKGLSGILRAPVLKTVGTRGRGIEALLDKAIEMVEKGERPDYQVHYGAEVEEDIALIVAAIGRDPHFSRKYSARWCAIKLLEQDGRALGLLKTHGEGEAVQKIVAERTRRIEEHFGRDAAIVVAEQRYGYIHGAASEAIRRNLVDKITVTEAVDRVLLNRFLGFPIFLFILWAVFQVTFRLSEYPMGWLESFFGWLSTVLGGALPEGLLRSLIIDGIIAGVGGVTSFVPLIIILFLFISILEDSGYMARSAFIMDKFLHIFGLHGQSFLPMIIGFGCSVPAIMAARTLKSPRDRIITVIVTPFMSCGAKLPVHVLLAGAFFGVRQGEVVLSIYVIGVVLALLSSWFFRHTVLRGEATPFVMELPPYRMPTWRGILWHVREKTFKYLKKAWFVLLPASVLIWAVSSFPRVPVTNDPVPLEETYLGRFGKGIEPVIRPLGFDWKIGISAITGFAAKEVVVSTLGVLYKVGDGEGEKGASLRQALRADPVFDPLVAYVLMLFTLIVIPCFASLAAIFSEIGWRWLVFAVSYWLALAWGLCFAVYQAGRLLGF